MFFQISQQKHEQIQKYKALNFKKTDSILLGRYFGSELRGDVRH